MFLLQLQQQKQHYIYWLVSFLWPYSVVIDERRFRQFLAVTSREWQDGGFSGWRGKMNGAKSLTQCLLLLVCLSVQVEKWKNKLSRCLCVGVGVGVWMGVGCLSLKQRNTCREWNKPKRCQKKKKGNQPDKTQSQKIPKHRTYDFFPTARAAFIGKLLLPLLTWVWRIN